MTYLKKAIALVTLTTFLFTNTASPVDFASVLPSDSARHANTHQMAFMNEHGPDGAKSELRFQELLGEKNPEVSSVDLKPVTDPTHRAELRSRANEMSTWVEGSLSPALQQLSFRTAPDLTVLKEVGNKLPTEGQNDRNDWNVAVQEAQDSVQVLTSQNLSPVILAQEVIYRLSSKFFIPRGFLLDVVSGTRTNQFQGLTFRKITEERRYQTADHEVAIYFTNQLWGQLPDIYPTYFSPIAGHVVVINDLPENEFSIVSKILDSLKSPTGKRAFQIMFQDSPPNLYDRVITIYDEMASEIETAKTNAAEDHLLQELKHAADYATIEKALGRRILDRYDAEAASWYLRHKVMPDGFIGKIVQDITANPREYRYENTKVAKQYLANEILEVRGHLVESIYAANPKVLLLVFLAMIIQTMKLRAASRSLPNELQTYYFMAAVIPVLLASHFNMEHPEILNELALLGERGIFDAEHVLLILEIMRRSNEEIRNALKQAYQSEFSDSFEVPKRKSELRGDQTLLHDTFEELIAHQTRTNRAELRAQTWKKVVIGIMSAAFLGGVGCVQQRSISKVEPAQPQASSQPISIPEPQEPVSTQSSEKKEKVTHSIPVIEPKPEPTKPEAFVIEEDEAYRLYHQVSNLINQIEELHRAIRETETISESSAILLSSAPSSSDFTSKPIERRRMHFITRFHLENIDPAKLVAEIKYIQEEINQLAKVVKTLRKADKESVANNIQEIEFTLQNLREIIFTGEKIEEKSIPKLLREAQDRLQVLKTKVDEKLTERNIYLERAGELMSQTWYFLDHLPKEIKEKPPNVSNKEIKEILQSIKPLLSRLEALTDLPQGRDVTRKHLIGQLTQLEIELKNWLLQLETAPSVQSEQKEFKTPEVVERYSTRSDKSSKESSTQFAEPSFEPKQTLSWIWILGWVVSIVFMILVINYKTWIGVGIKNIAWLPVAVAMLPINVLSWIVAGIVGIFVSLFKIPTILNIIRLYMRDFYIPSFSREYSLARHGEYYLYDPLEPRDNDSYWTNLSLFFQRRWRWMTGRYWDDFLQHAEKHALPPSKDPTFIPYSQRAPAFKSSPAEESKTQTTPRPSPKPFTGIQVFDDDDALESKLPGDESETQPKTSLSEQVENHLDRSAPQSFTNQFWGTGTSLSDLLPPLPQGLSPEIQDRIARAIANYINGLPQGYGGGRPLTDYEIRSFQNRMLEIYHANGAFGFGGMSGTRGFGSVSSSGLRGASSHSRIARGGLQNSTNDLRRSLGTYVPPSRSEEEKLNKLSEKIAQSHQVNRTQTIEFRGRKYAVKIQFIPIGEYFFVDIYDKQNEKQVVGRIVYQLIGPTGFDVPYLYYDSKNSESYLLLLAVLKQIAVDLQRQAGFDHFQIFYQPHLPMKRLMTDIHSRWQLRHNISPRILGYEGKRWSAYPISNYPPFLHNVKESDEIKILSSKRESQNKETVASDFGVFAENDLLNILKIAGGNETHETRVIKDNIKVDIIYTVPLGNTGKNIYLINKATRDGEKVPLDAVGAFAQTDGIYLVANETLRIMQEILERIQAIRGSPINLEQRILSQAVSGKSKTEIIHDAFEHILLHELDHYFRLVSGKAISSSVPEEMSAYLAPVRFGSNVDLQAFILLSADAPFEPHKTAISNIQSKFVSQSFRNEASWLNADPTYSAALLALAMTPSQGTKKLLNAQYNYSSLAQSQEEAKGILAFRNSFRTTRAELRSASPAINSLQNKYNQVERALPHTLQDIDFEHNAEAMIQNIIQQRPPNFSLSPQQENELRNLVKEYLKHLRMAHFIRWGSIWRRIERGNQVQDIIDENRMRFLLLDSHGMLISQRLLMNLIWQGEPSLDFDISGFSGSGGTIDKIMDSPNFVSFSYGQMAGEPDRVTGYLPNELIRDAEVAVVLKEESSRIKNQIAFNVPDNEYLVQMAGFGEVSPEEVKTKLLSPAALQEIIEQLIVSKGLKGADKKSALKGFSMGSFLMGFVPFTPFSDREIKIPEGVGPDFVETIVLSDKVYNVLSSKPWWNQVRVNVVKASDYFKRDSEDRYVNPRLRQLEASEKAIQDFFFRAELREVMTNQKQKEEFDSLDSTDLIYPETKNELQEIVEGMRELALGPLVGMMDGIRRLTGIDLNTSQPVAVQNRNELRILAFCPAVSMELADLVAQVTQEVAQRSEMRVVIFARTSQEAKAIQTLFPVQFQSKIESGDILITTRTNDEAQILRGAKRAELRAVGLPEDKSFADLLSKRLPHISVTQQIVPKEQILSLFGQLTETIRSELRAKFIQSIAA